MSIGIALRRAPVPLAAPSTPAAQATRTARVAPHDVALAALVLVVEAALALLLPEGPGSNRPDSAGWLLLTAGAAVLVWRRRYPMACLIGMVAAVAPYHYLENIQVAVIPSSMVALYSLALAGPPLRTFLVVPSMVIMMAVVMATMGRPHTGTDALQSGGWIIAVAVVGEVVRVHRAYLAAVVERAERAERTREEEAARRVAEERLRIARDLHDLLAHSITLIGVQTSVAAHVLVADPDRLDRAAVADALDAIAETCREARVELRTTLRVLRADENGPLPDLAGIPALVQAAEAAGARVELALDAGPGPVPPAVGAAAYRIVQESLTNAVRHAEAAGPGVTVAVRRAGPALRLLIRDDGGSPGPATGVPSASVGSAPGRGGAAPAGAAPAGAVIPGGPARGEGFGIVGMRERARSVGGTLTAGPRADGPGFKVTADLPFPGQAGPDGRPGPEPGPAEAPAPGPTAPSSTGSGPTGLGPAEPGAATSDVTTRKTADTGGRG
ncbi:sensor histidine kinase [Actinacidiphila acididurans]|uniref:histidine kinase n=1 Tax=Actinacidiphila acididurans TaxID=2784346 RepID=A0ABS2TYU2_9ACTN|nr:sensor histidine kinase [Actinacidiphila acididurans]MBM9508257.1 sensor histidine kinase [Actinacidiphila acididurans]